MTSTPTELTWWERLASRCVRKSKVRVIYDRVQSDPYLERYYLHPRWMTLGLFRVVLHRFMRSDSPADGLHDHPWPYISIILSDGYWEHLPNGVVHWRKPGTIVFARARRLHRVRLKGDTKPWTLFIMGPRIRSWGFLIHGKWYPWREWIALRNRDRAA